jgi:hypothetical protein
MKRLLLTLLAGATLSFGTTIDFTEVPTSNMTPITTEWSSFGITAEDMYFYEDSRDTFDTKGLSINSDSGGSIIFASLLNALSIDYWVIGGHSATYDVYDASNNLLQTFSVDALAGDVLGSFSFASTDIAKLVMTGTRGFTQVSTLVFDAAAGANTPEPSTLAMGMIGIGLVALARLRKSH